MVAALRQVHGERSWASGAAIAASAAQRSSTARSLARSAAAIRGQPVTVGGFDDAEQDPIDEDAASDAVSAEAQGHTHGIQVLERAFAARKSYRVREVPLKDAEATALARAALLGRARRFVTACGVADGSTAIKVGSLLRLERVSPMFEGDGYYVTRVRHQFDLTNGYRTHFEAERVWIGSGR